MKYLSKLITSEPGKLPVIKRFAYGVGHVFNDLCAAMWFSYLLLFFQQVISFSNTMAGYIMLLGQVVDGVCTPFIGYESDRTNGFRKYGKRKSWHLVGTICVVATFSFLFMPVLGTEKADDWARFIYYAPFVIIFQFGWAAVQISHLSMIPELTPNVNQRVELNAIRYSFLVISNIAVYAVTWLLLGIEEGEQNSQLGPQDAPTFRNLALIMCGTGLLFTIIFHVGVKEKHKDSSDKQVVAKSKENEKQVVVKEKKNKKDSDKQTAIKKEEKKTSIMRWWKWFLEPQFYQIAFLYMCTRLIFNMSQVYLPLFLTSSLQLQKTYIATIPLTVYISGFLTSLLMKVVNKHIGRKLTYLIGALLIGVASCWLWFTRQGAEWQIFVASGIMGAGTSTILVTSLAMVADLIGHRTESGAFVYGAMSFTDKLSNGIGIFLLQQNYTCETTKCCVACVSYYRNIIVILPATLAGLAIIALVTLAPVTIGNLRRKTGVPDQEKEITDKEGPHVVEIEEKPGVKDYINEMAESTYI